MSGQRHPGTESIASSRAGLSGGFRGRRLTAHIAGCARCAAVSDQLGAVGSALASVPVPALPDAFERQISAAIAAEATAREASVPRRSRPRPARSLSRRGLRLRPVMAAIPVLACLLAGLGYLVRIGSSSGPSYQGTSASEPTGLHAASSAGAPANAAGPEAAPLPAEGLAAGFLVDRSGVRYTAATLRAQARARLRSPGGSSSARSPVRSAAPSASGTVTNGLAGRTGSFVPSQALAGCVLQLTGGVRPSFVDYALYQGKPAYVIIVPNRVWVVGPGCTASRPEQIASVPLTGAS